MVTSLVLANRSSATRVPDAAFKKAMSGDGGGGELADYPISLVVTNNTLVQQWHGERPRHLTLTGPDCDCPSFHRAQTRSSSSPRASRCLCTTT